jgi:nicotinate dehydrogenase subunit B
MAEILDARTFAKTDLAHEAGARLFEGACASCHEPLSAAPAGPAGPAGAAAPQARASLALNTNVHGATPTNVLRAVLDGVNVATLGPEGAMPAFRGSLDDRQIGELLSYLRARFASDKPAWTGLAEATARSRVIRPGGGDISR